MPHILGDLCAPNIFMDQKSLFDSKIVSTSKPQVSCSEQELFCMSWWSTWSQKQVE